MKQALSILLFAAITMAISSCSSGTRLTVPTPKEAAYDGVRPVAISAVSHRELFVAGNMTRKDGTPEGLILASENGGRIWRRLGTEVHDLRRLTFQTVYFADRLRGWAAGIRVNDDGNTIATVFRTEDAGNHWHETVLHQDPENLITEVHDLRFDSDLQGRVSVTHLPKGKLPSVTTFISVDGGRSFVVESFQETATNPMHDASISMIDDKRGFRLSQGEIPGITRLEATASGGKDWMPVSDIALSDADTWY